MSYLAAVTDWLKAWGPVAWGALGILSALIIWNALAIGSYIRSAKRAKDARAGFDETASKLPYRINTLDREFNRLVISISSLFVHYAPVLEASNSMIAT